MLIGIDVGGTNLVAAKINDSGQIINKVKATVTHNDTADDLCRKILSIAKSAAGSDETIEAVGVGFPGLTDNATGTIIKTPNMPFNNTHFRDVFQKEWDVPVYIGNDANCAAVGEFCAGAAKGYDSSLTITLGTGIGGGFILHGKLFNGFSNGAMEVGHMIIDPNGHMCGCGNRGCFEQYGSATALIRDAKYYMSENKNSVLWELCGGKVEMLDGQMIFEAAGNNDYTAMRTIEDYTTYLAIGISNLINILQPEIICLGGGISHADEKLLLVPIKDKIRSYIYDKEADLHIEKALLGNDAGLIGAAMLCKMI